MRKYAVTLAVLLLAAVSLAGCGGSGGSGDASGAGSSGRPGGAVGQPGSARAAALHAFGQCIREHGIPAYADPVLTQDGTIYTDQRGLQGSSRAIRSAVQQACGGLAARAGLNPGSEPPAPPQLVAAGVRAAQCLRAHGMSNVRDPSPESPYTPGHGFGMTPDEMPAGGKASPVYQAAAQACRSQLDGEIRASTLADLGNDG
jgi:predicted small secreted protein